MPSIPTESNQLTTNEQIDITQFNISRYDNYYDSVNNKGMFYLTFNTFILSGMCASFITLKPSINSNIIIYILLIIILITCTISIIYTIISLNPFLKSNYLNTSSRKSLLFFGDVASISANEYVDSCKNQTRNELLEDLINQNHALANGLNMKFKRLKCAGDLILVQFFFVLVIIPFIIFNLK